MLNFYYRHPIMCDYIMAGIIATVAYYLTVYGYLTLPVADRLFSTISDMSTIGLTMAGFILTVVTVLISFKSTNKINGIKVKDSDKVFDLFFASKLYYETIKILNNAIKSLSAIALIGYMFKLMVSSSFIQQLYLYCVFGIIVIILTVIRCVFILTTIVKMQSNK